MTANETGEARSNPTLRPGTVIDSRYRVVKALGRGGFATVYEAEHVHMQRVAAVKVLDAPRSLEDDGGTYAERFLREARIISSIRHPNVVMVYDFGFSGDQPYIAMELLEGHDLHHEIRRKGPLDPARAHRLFVPALDALGAGHDAGVVHKDLKPSNLFLVDPGTSRERMVVLDYGVARVNEAELANLTETGELLGTPKYLAPEYIRQHIVTPAIDVYQMALIISEALCGRSATSGNPYQAMMRHCSGDLDIPPQLLEGPIGEVMRVALDVDHTRRFADGHVFSEALADLGDAFAAMVPLPGNVGPADERQTQMVGDATDPTPAPFSTASTTFDSTREVAPSVSTQRRPHPGAIALAIVGLVGIVGAVSYVVSTGDEPGETEAEAATSAAETPEEGVVTPEGHVDVLFVSTPSGATVHIDGQYEGDTPLELPLPLGEAVEVAVAAPAYDTLITELTPVDGQEPFVAALAPTALPEASVVVEPVADESGDAAPSDPPPVADETAAADGEPGPREAPGDSAEKTADSADETVEAAAPTPPTEAEIAAEREKARRKRAESAEGERTRKERRSERESSPKAADEPEKKDDGWGLIE